MVTESQRGTRSIGVILGSILLALGVILILWVWIEQGRFFGAAFILIFFGVSSIVTARRRR